MEALDTLLLSRIQFAANISFHILFPTITIALGWVLLFFRLRFTRTGDEKWMAAYRFWVKVFALSFAMGVVSGITMSFQFGTNWPGFMETVGNIAGPLLAYEVLTAFFLEAAFIGVMLFGFSRVPAWLHITATALVAFGTTLSTFWIIVLNSWMHTPQGYEMIDGVAYATSWWEVVFNPSMPYRFAHMVLASFLTVSFLVAGVSAFRLLLGDRSRDVRVTLKTGVALGAILIPEGIEPVAATRRGRSRPGPATARRPNRGKTHIPALARRSKGRHPSGQRKRARVGHAWRHRAWGGSIGRDGQPADSRDGASTRAGRAVRSGRRAAPVRHGGDDDDGGLGTRRDAIVRTRQIRSG